MKLVSVKIPAKANNTIPNVPAMTLVKNNVKITAAINNLIIRSAEPMFFFIMFNF